MIEVNLIWIISLIGFLFSILASVLIANFLFVPFDNDKNVFKRVFPFEVISNLKSGFNAYKILIFVFAGLAFSPLFFLIGEDSYFKSLNGLAYVITSLLGLGGIMYVFLHFFNPSHIKTHLIIVVILVAIIFSAGILSFVLSFLLYQSTNIIYLIFGIFSLILALFEIVSIFTFKLKNWANLEKENGILKRPQFFPLASYEWLSVLFLTLEEVSFFLLLIKY